MDEGVNLKPRLRGVLHQWAFVVFVGLAALLIALATEAAERAAAATFAGALVAMFGTSAIYHRVNWRSVAARMWWRRLDHAMIYVLIAGTYTPFALLALEGAWRWSVLSVIWSGALAAIVVMLAWVDAPKWLSAALGILLGWVGIVMLPELVGAIGVWGTILLAVGGLLYTFGAIVYARRRPDPVPTVFGYHEVFHACVIGAAACQYAVVAMLVAS
jgi:hemolysin III